MPSPTSESQPSDRASATRMGRERNGLFKYAHHRADQHADEHHDAQHDILARGVPPDYRREHALQNPALIEHEERPSDQQQKDHNHDRRDPVLPRQHLKRSGDHRQTGRRGASGVSA